MTSFPLVPMLRRQRELYDVPRSRERLAVADALASDRTPEEALIEAARQSSA